jgi:hypothetical protein
VCAVHGMRAAYCLQHQSRQKQANPNQESNSARGRCHALPARRSPPDWCSLHCFVHGGSQHRAPMPAAGSPQRLAERGVKSTAAQRAVQQMARPRSWPNPGNPVSGPTSIPLDAPRMYVCGHNKATAGKPSHPSKHPNGNKTTPVSSKQAYPAPPASPSGGHQACLTGSAGCNTLKDAGGCL